MSPLDKALAQVREVDADFADLMVSIYRRRWTGHMGIDFLNGVPRRATGDGLRIRLTQPAFSTVVDKAAKLADAVSV